MHAKHRNGRVQLYRSTYVRKGEKGNTHGYAQQQFVGSLPAESLAIPDDLAGKLTDAERGYVEREIIEPARQRAEDERLKAQARERDPNWRIVEAARLLKEARNLSDACPGVLDAVGAAGAVDVSEHLRGFVLPSRQNSQTNHPLNDALESIRRATKSVKDGDYGKAPEENVRATNEYQLWAAIKSAIDGAVDDSLLRAMQDAGFAKAKGR